MTIPVEERNAADQLKSFVEHNASDLITNSGSLCELSNKYQKLDKAERQDLFNLCVTHLKLIKKLGKIIQDDIDDV